MRFAEISFAVATVLIAPALGCSQKPSSTSADSGTDTDTDTDTETSTGTYRTDAGPWEWEDKPQGEDCGPGCVQLTSTNSLFSQEWDVGNGLLVYRNEKTDRIEVVDYEKKIKMTIPDIYQESSEDVILYIVVRPRIRNNDVYYLATVGFYQEKEKVAIIHADLVEEYQEVVWMVEVDDYVEDFPSDIADMEVYGNRVVFDGGFCEGMENPTICYLKQPWPSMGEILWECAFYPALWEDKVVCGELDEPPDDIGAYDLSTMEHFQVTDDDEYQIFPRIYQNRVVWQDFRLGEGEPTGSWEHSAVYCKDLISEETKKITDGSAIAAYPDINGDVVVWQDYRHCDDPQDKYDFANVEVYGYNLSTGVEFRVTELPGRQKCHPRVWGDKAFVDMDKLEGVNAIYMFDLPEEAK